MKLSKADLDVADADIKIFESEETVHRLRLATLRDLDRALYRGEILEMRKAFSIPGFNESDIYKSAAQNVIGHDQLVDKPRRTKFVEYSFHEGKNNNSRKRPSSLHHQQANDGTQKRYVKFLSSPSW